MSRAGASVHAAMAATPSDISGADVPVQDLGAARVELASSSGAAARTAWAMSARGSCRSGSGAVLSVQAYWLLDFDELIVVTRRSELQLQLTPERPGNALERVPTRRADVEAFLEARDGGLAGPDPTRELGLGEAGAHAHAPDRDGNLVNDAPLFEMMAHARVGELGSEKGIAIDSGGSLLLAHWVDPPRTSFIRAVAFKMSRD
jgi:hypothetical protein